nr:SURF1 family protein [uncultured Brevundimonas sp.]
MSVAALVLFVGFLALGGWQVQRLMWKTALIAQVDARVHAAPVPAPEPAQWAAITRSDDQYRRVSVRGVFQNDRETLVQAVTDAGAGFWVMTPLTDARGFTVLVNRGFVTPERRDPGLRANGQLSGEQTVVGLLRISEPKGGFLRANEPQADRWRSRDVAAIAARREISNAAPYFIDADATPNPGGWPLGGLTVIRFPNSHLIYALTWFGMALLTVVGFGLFLREERRRRA